MTIYFFTESDRTINADSKEFRQPDGADTERREPVAGRNCMLV
jgi:hypothetical protein